jgi:hypothetical protein
MTKNKSVSWYKRTIFWEMVKRTLAVVSGPTVYGLHELAVGDTTMLIAGSVAMIAAVISIWFVDNDSDGIIDLFQIKIKPPVNPDENN